MAKDVLITPLDGIIAFSASDGTGTGQIKVDSNDLVISNLVGDVLLGDGASDVFIGNGSDNVDIIFEQNGEIKDDGSGKNITLGSKTTNVFITGSTIVMQKDSGNVGIGKSAPTKTLEVAGDISASGDLHIQGSLTASGHISASIIRAKEIRDHANGHLTIRPDAELNLGTAGTDEINIGRTDSTSCDLQVFAGSSDATLRIVNKQAIFAHPITASSNISSSETIEAHKFKVDNNTGLQSYLVDGTEMTIVSLNSSDIQNYGGNGIDLQSHKFQTKQNGQSLFITASGANTPRIGINTLTPGKTLEVIGDISASGTLFGNSLTLDGTAVAATAAELNIIDGGTAASNITPIDGDRVVYNDGGVMKQVTMTKLASYFDDEITNMPNLADIGTNLTVDGNLTTTGNISGSATKTGSFANIIAGQLDAGHVPKGNLRVKSDSNHKAIMIEENSSNESYVLGVNAAGDFNIFNSGDTTPNFVITDGNNVGIGTTTPSQPLEVAGNISASGGLFFGGTGGPFISSSAVDGKLTVSGSGITIHNGNQDGTLTIQRFSGDIGQLSAANTRLTLKALSNKNISLEDDAGNVGVFVKDGGKVTIGGTSTPQEALSVTGNISSSAAVSGSGGNYIGNRRFNKSTNTDASHQGDIVYFGGTTGLVAGRIYHYKSDGTWEDADPNAASTSDGLLAVALGTNSDVDGMLLRGTVTLNHNPGAIGDVLYLNEAAAPSGTPSHGRATNGAPAGNADIVRVVGYCISSSAADGQIWFNPDNTFVEVDA